MRIKLTIPPMTSPIIAFVCPDLGGCVAFEFEEDINVEEALTAE